MSKLLTNVTVLQKAITQADLPERTPCCLRWSVSLSLRAAQLLKTPVIWEWITNRIYLISHKLTSLDCFSATHTHNHAVYYYISVHGAARSFSPREVHVHLVLTECCFKSEKVTAYSYWVISSPLLVYDPRRVFITLGCKMVSNTLATKVKNIPRVPRWVY